MSARKATQLVTGMETSDGAGVALTRVIGSPLLDYLDPFLMLDEFGSEDGADYIAGFPDHPHRGIETVTYMLDGIMRHGDNKGNGGQLLPGGAQWMTAGRGIVHSEMPEQKEGLMRGFQLWVNLPAADKMCEPRYQNFTPEDVPEVTQDNGTRVRIVAGSLDGIEGAVRGIAANPTYLDVKMPANATFNYDLAIDHTAFLYVFEGEVSVEGKQIDLSTLAVLEDGDSLAVKTGDAEGRFILVAGAPLNEPVARYGPFVMNTREEIQQAFEDYRAGKF